MNEQPTLSPRTTERLKEAHARRETDGFEALYALVSALRAAGWTLQAIADPLGVSREAVRMWERKMVGRPLPSVTVEVPAHTIPKATIAAEESQARRIARDRREAEVLAANLPRLLELQPEAQNLRGPSANNPARADASKEYTHLINTTLRSGVRTRVLAEALGVQMITLNARLRRSGLRKTAPSEKVPAWAKADWSA